MTNTTHTVVCLYIENPATSEKAYVIGYLVKDEPDRVIIAQSIHQATGLPYQEISIKIAHIKQRYDLPVTFW